MNKQVDFTQLLSKSADEVTKPVSLPIGSYRVVLAGFATHVSKQKQTPALRFDVSVLEAKEDVDAAQLDSFTSTGSYLSSVKLRHDFWMGENSQYRFTEFVKNVLGMNVSGRSLAQLAEDCVGKEAIAKIKHRTSEDGNTTYAEIENFYAL